MFLEYYFGEYISFRAFGYMCIFANRVIGWKIIMVNINHGKKENLHVSSLLNNPWRARASIILGIRGHKSPPTLRLRLHSGALAASFSWYFHSPEGKFPEQSPSLDLMHESRY